MIETLKADGLTKQSLWNRFEALLNRRPLIITVVFGLFSYIFALGCGFVGVMVSQHSVIFTAVCLLGAIMVLTYHFIMARFQRVSVVAQLLHLSGALLFVYLGIALPIRTSLLMD